MNKRSEESRQVEQSSAGVVEQASSEGPWGRCQASLRAQLEGNDNRSIAALLSMFQWQVSALSAAPVVNPEDAYVGRQQGRQPGVLLIDFGPSNLLGSLDCRSCVSRREGPIRPVWRIHIHQCQPC